MSDNILKLIPTRPDYMPDPVAQEQVQYLFASFVPQADEVLSSITDEVVFVDQGANFERASCPNCQAEDEPNWWRQAMDAAYENRFTDLMVTMPCCGTSCSLNDLNYEWPAGFARFVLEARNPNTDLDEFQIRRLEEKLGCTIRKIWAHY